MTVGGAGVTGLPLLLTVEEAASLLRLGRTRVYQLVMGGKIQSVKVGRRRLVVREGLEEFVAQLVEDQAAR
jgi:excisionase family DNA binding protein